MNKVTLIGNVGKDPETKTLESGTKVTQFTLATSEKWKDKEGNKQEETTWHNIVLWRGLAEVAEKYVKKGSQLAIEGKITSRSYDDKEGVTRYITEIVGKDMKMLGSKPQGSAPEPAPVTEEPKKKSSKQKDLPF